MYVGSPVYQPVFNHLLTHVVIAGNHLTNTSYCWSRYGAFPKAHVPIGMLAGDFTTRQYSQSLKLMFFFCFLFFDNYKLLMYLSIRLTGQWSAL